MRVLHTCALAALCCVAACDDGADAPAAADMGTDNVITGGESNILLIVLDDVGIDAVNLYRAELGLEETGPSMPEFEALAADGVLFLNAWSNPVCSPTRAGIHTGKYAFRTGVGDALSSADDGLSLDEITLPELIGDTYETALIGKWHLGETEATGGLGSPNEHGWGHYHGPVSGDIDDYFAWQEIEDGVDNGINTEYALSWKVDRAIEWISGQDGSKPWMLMLALNAPHTPFHAPPSGLHAQTLTTVEGETCGEDEEQACYFAMIEAADTEIGRLVDALGTHADNTTIIVIGDNGAPRSVVSDPFTRTHAKGSVYAGGVHVPFLISGSEVTSGGRTEAGLVQTLDLFTTIVRLAGGDPSTGTDGVTLVPYIKNRTPNSARTYLLTEKFDDGDTSAADLAIRNANFSVVVPAGGSAECYRLANDTNQENDLNAGDSPPDICATLEARITSIRGE